MSAPFVWTDEAVRRALGLEGGEAEPAYYAVGTDTRTLPAGALFVALEGPRFDGHAFVAEAAAAGARGVVVHRPVEAPAGVAVYRVADTLQALGALARHRREALRAPVVAVTGSSGKTSTKAFLEAALAAGRRVHATPGNLNNRVGLPLTLLAAPDEAEVVVLEMGTSEPGEIAALTEVARPDVGVVTTVAEAHVEGLGSLEGVLAEKLALLRGLAPDGRALVGAEPPLLAEAARALRADVRVAGWGEAADADLTPVDVHRMDDGRWGFTWRGEQVALGVPGRHAVTNALLALAVAETLGVPAAAAARAVGDVRPGALRGELRRVGGLTLLVDCYNANPQSVRAALDTLADLEARARVAFLGSMLELGDLSAPLHQDVLHYALDTRLERVVATGDFARAAEAMADEAAVDEALAGDPPRLLVRATPDEAYDVLAPTLAGDEAVLLKASRGVALERLLPRFEADFGAAHAAAGGEG